MDELPPDEQTDIEDTFALLYKTCVERWRWSLKDIDDSNLETFMDFIFFKEQADPNTRIINGKKYIRANKAPSWL